MDWTRVQYDVKCSMLNCLVFFVHQLALCHLKVYSDLIMWPHMLQADCIDNDDHSKMSNPPLESPELIKCHSSI